MPASNRSTTTSSSLPRCVSGTETRATSCGSASARTSLRLVEWINAHPLPSPLDILTNLEDGVRPPAATQLGIRVDLPVRICDWSPTRQLEMTAAARGFLDIKGNDFRARHKPPAEGIDAIASGVPLAMTPESSTVEHLARMGFEVASPLDPERWFSRDYWEEARRFGLALRELLSLKRVARRLKRIVTEAVGERDGTLTRQGYPDGMYPSSGSAPCTYLEPARVSTLTWGGYA